MAENNDMTIDSLQIEIASSSAKAEQSIDRLCASLMGLNTPLKKIGNNVGNVRSVIKALSGLDGLKMPDLSKTIDQLDKLSRIDLKNLQDKKLNLSLEISGFDKAERLKYAVQKTASDIHTITDGIAKDLADTYNIKGADADKLTNMIAQMGKNIAVDKNRMGDLNDTEEVFKFIIEHGKVARESFDESITGMKEVYKDFLAYVNQNKIKLTDAVDTRNFNESTSRTERQLFFNQKSGKNIDTIWEDMISNFPGIMMNIRDIENEEDQVYALLEKIRFTKDELANKTISLFDPNEISKIKTNVFNSVNDSYVKAIDGVNSTIASNMQKSAKTIPLDLKIDPNRFVTQIERAINEAAKKDYGKINVKLGVDTSNLKQELKNSFEGLQIKDISQVSGDVDTLRKQLQNLQSVDLKTGGITSFINAFARLSTESKNFDINSMDELFKQLDKISQIDPESVNIFKSISSFLRSTQKLSETVKVFPQLAVEVQSFFDYLSNITISDNVAQTANALAQISMSGKRAGTSIESFKNNVHNGNSTIKRANQILKVFGDSVKTLSSLFKKLGIIVADTYKGILSGTAKIAKGIGTNAVNAIQSFSNKIKDLSKSKSSVDSMHFSLKNLLATVIGFRGITGVFNWSKEALKLGGDITEIDHIIESVFGENMTGYINDWADNAIKQFGIAKGAAKQYAGTLNAMFKASNISSDNSSVMAVKMVELAGDLSAFYNIDTADAYQKIQAGLAGMVRPLRSLGIDLSVATLKEYALARGITKSWTEMTQAEKVMLRYQYLLDHTAMQAGDFQRTSESLANGIRILRANFESITTELGVGFAAAIRHVVILLNKLLEKVLVVAKAFSTFMQTLFGKYKGGSGGFTFEDYGMDEAQDELDGMSDSASGIADGFADADEATKKLAKDLSVLPFDELNQLSKDIQNSTDTKKEKEPSSGTYTPNIGNFDEMMGDMFDLDFDGLESPLKKLEDYVSEWAKRIKEQFDKRNWDGLGREVAKGINDFIDYLLKIFNPTEVKEKIGYWIDAFTESFNGLIDEIDFEDIGTLIGEGIDVVISSVNRFIEGIDWKRLGEQLANGANSLVEAVPFDEIGNFFANKLNMIWQTAEGFAKRFDWGNLGEKLAEGANAFVDKVDLESLANMLSHGLNGIADAVNRFAENFKWANAGRKLAKNANLLISQIDINKIGTALGNVLNGLFTVAYNFVSNFNWKELGSMFAKGINSLIDTVNFDFIASTVYTGLNGIIDSIRSFFADLDVVTAGNKIGKAFADMINGIHWKDLGTGLAEIWNKAWSFLNEFISNLGTTDVRVEGLYSFNNISQSDIDKALKKGTGIGQAIHDALKSAIESVKTEDMVDSINNLVKKIAYDISTAFGDPSMWFDLGKKFGDAFSQIIGNKENGKDLAQAFNDLVDAFLFLIRGVISGLSEHKGEIGESLVTIFKEIDWGDLALLVGAAATAKIIEKIPIILAGCALKSTLEKELSKIFTGVGASESVVTSGGAIFNSIKTAIMSPAGLIGAIAAASKAVAELYDLLRGGNGILTETGAAIDSLVNELGGMNKITPELREELFHLKEDLELNKITSEEFGQKFVEALQKSNVSAEEAKGIIASLGERLGGLNENQVQTLLDLISEMPETAGTSGDALSQLGVTGEEAFNGIRRGITDAGAEFGAQGLIVSQSLAENIESAQRFGTDVGVALDEAKNKWEEQGLSVETLRNKIDNYLEEGAFDALITSVNNSGEAFDSTKSKVDEYGNSVKTAGELAETATGHTDAYNEATGKSPSLIETLLPIIGGLASKFLASFGQKDQYYSTMETNIDETGKAVDDKGSVLTNAIQTLASKALATFRTNLPNYKSSAEEIPKGISTGIDEKQQEPVDMVQQMSEMMQEKFALHNGIHSPSTVYSEMAENIPLGVSEGIKNKEPDVLNALESFATSMTTKAETLVNNLKSSLEKGGSEAVEKLVNGMQSKEDVLSQQIEKIKGIFDKFAESVSEIANSAYRQGEMITGKLVEGMDSRKDELDRVIVDIATSLTEFVKFIELVKDKTEEEASGISNGLVSGLNSSRDDVSEIFNDISSKFDDFLGNLSDIAEEFKTAGENIINALQEGLNSAKLMIPTINVEWETKYYNNGQNWVDIPKFSVEYPWFAKGGLFTDPSIVGIGEAGDEAVIPLTNRRTMGMIADAITANSSGIGLDEQSLIDAVAQGYVRAMMANQNNQQQPIINVVCKTENDEVLFRAVERGRSSVQYRNNPTAQY